MNRIICDICGSEYPETAERCPVCNYPRQGTEKLVAAESEIVQTRVKGGRFSSKNVKKRQKAMRKAAQGEGNPNKPLIIVIILLLVAIVLVSVYIGVRFLYGSGYLKSGQQTTASTAVPTGTTQPPTVPCQGLVMETNVLDLETLGEQKQITVTAVPGDTTDVLTFVSADPAVAQVDENGMITAVGSGQTTITITCGDVVKTCTVVCWFQPETTAPVETTAPQVIEPEPTETKATEPKETEPAVLKLDPEDVSCFTKGESFTIYARLGGSTVSRSKVTWTTSDSKIAKVENGTVTAVGKGTATITAEYNGQKA